MDHVLVYDGQKHEVTAFFVNRMEESAEATVSLQGMEPEAVLKSIALKRIIHSVHRLKKFTITRYWNILSLCGSGVLLSAPYPLQQPLMMKFSLIYLPSVNRDISPPTAPMLLSLYKLPVNWDTMVMTSNRSSSISPSSPVKAICTV